MIPTLKPFQRDTNERVIAARKAGAKVIVLCSPTGSGKTTMACDLIRRAVAKGSRVLEIVHRRRLVEQFYQRLEQFDVPYGVLMRGDRQFRPSAPVQVASRDTLLSRVVANGYLPPPPAQLVIVDEGRHAASPEFRRLLKPYEEQGATIVLLDATPVLPDGRGLGPWAQALVVAAKVTDLVRQGDLVPVKCFAPDRTVVRGKVRRGIAGDLVESWRQYGENLPTVLFCSRVQHSLDAVAAYNAAGIPAVHLDADTKDDDRDRAYAALETGKIKVVANVGIIKEGVDVPCLGCCQFYMDPKGRVGFLQGAGRIMRPYPGKAHGVLIDHAGAVFRHGFPDEDTEWSLDGDTDANFAARHKDGKTEKALYCKPCALLYHGSPVCPQCGRPPSKPPRSIFAAPDVDLSHEILTEADRAGERPQPGREEMVQHWYRCLAVARKRGGTFGMASAVFKQKYNRYPPEDFPMNPATWAERKLRVSDVYPNFGVGARQ